MAFLDFAFKKRVPSIMQMESLECGAASLTMILAYYGKWLPLEEVRVSCGVSRDGSNLKDIADAGTMYGLIPSAYKCDVEDLVTVDLPAIIHWNFNHFVVLVKIKSHYAIINDPARGRVKISIEELDSAFTGVVMCFEKGPNFVPSGKPKSVIKFVKNRLKGTLEPFLFVMISGFLITLTDIIIPILSRLFFDNVLIPDANLSPKGADWFLPLIYFMLFLVIFRLFTASIKEIYILKMRARLAISASSSFIWHVLKLPMEFFSQRTVGDIAERQSSNEGIAHSLIQELAPVVLNLFMLVFYFVVLLKISTILTIIGILACVINIFLSMYISSKRVNFSRLQMQDEGKLASSTVSGIKMIETIKAAGAENGFFEKWAGYQALVNSAKVKTEKVNKYLGALPEIVTEISVFATSLTGAALMMTTNYFTLGLLMQFQAYFRSFVEPVDDIRAAGQKVQETRTLMERVEDVMNYAPDVVFDSSDEIEKSDSKGIYKKLTGNIEIKNLTFGYKRLSKPLIENFSLTLKPGKKVALVGPSGCGKSTISSLISGLYKPWSGSILFDGLEISKIKRNVFTASLAVVDQDISMFEDTILDNIKVWDKSIEDFEVIMAARDADMHMDIVGREGGYNAIVKENGKNFSGGQRQRIEIARTLAQDPTIIVLDEATSALDAETEYKVVKAIEARGITCIVVAHRLSTIRDCDEIIVLDKGKIVQRGTHEDLYNVEGFYKKLISVE